MFLPSVDDLREHYEIRIALEELAAGKAAERFEPDWAAPLEALLEEMRTGPPAEAYLELNRASTPSCTHARGVTGWWR